MTMISEIRSFADDLLDFVFPRTCVACGERLHKNEKHLCADCLLHLPRTGLSSAEGNSIEQLFWGRVDIERAAAFFKYRHASSYHQILMELKYRNNPDIGIFMGRMMARELQSERFFEGVDVIVPVPLSTDRLRSRGYNQSEMIARGLSEITGIAVNTKAVVRVHSNVSQTKFGRLQRQENVKDIFSLAEPEQLSEKHVLVVDDVLTTGATLCSLIQEIEKVGNVRCSALAMAVASM